MAKSRFQKKHGRGAVKKRRSSRAKRSPLKFASKSLKRTVKALIRSNAHEHYKTTIDLGFDTGLIYPCFSQAETAGLGAGFFCPFNQWQYDNGSSDSATQGITGRQYEVDSFTLCFRIRWKSNQKMSRQRARFILMGARSKGAGDLLIDISSPNQTWYKAADPEYMIENTKVAHPNIPILAERRFDLVEPLTAPGAIAPSYYYQNFIYTHKFTRPWKITMEKNGSDFSFSSITKGAVIAMILLEDATVYVADQQFMHITSTVSYRDV